LTQQGISPFTPKSLDMNDSQFAPPKAILFDLDGLIVDTEPLHFRAFQVLLARRGIALPEEVMPSLIGFDQVTNLTDLKQTYHLPESVGDLLRERMQVYEEIILTATIPPLAGFWELGDAAQSLGLKRAVVTSSTQRQVHIILTRLFETAHRDSDYSSFFDTVVTGDDVAETKPAPDLYLLAPRRLGLTPADCLALEDTSAGVSAAVAAGVRCLAVPSQYARIEDFTGQFATLQSLHDVLPYLHNSHLDPHS
jgi:beta-phosphoglucomutase-like phosphatase (HAD superfamily)